MKIGHKKAGRFHRVFLVVGPIEVEVDYSWWGVGINAQLRWKR